MCVSVCVSVYILFPLLTSAGLIASGYNQTRTSERFPAQSPVSYLWLLFPSFRARFQRPSLTSVWLHVSHHSGACLPQSDESLPDSDSEQMRAEELSRPEDGSWGGVSSWYLRSKAFTVNCCPESPVKFFFRLRNFAHCSIFDAFLASVQWEMEFQLSSYKMYYTGCLSIAMIHRHFL